MRALLLMVSMQLLACGDADHGRAGADASNTAVADAAAGSLPTRCSGDCQAMDLLVEFGSTSRTFDRAFFGLTAPAQADSGDWEIYIENNAGDDEACPTVSSPTPAFILTVAGLALPTPGVFSGTATLVDFEGALLTETVFEQASSNAVTWTAADPCLACAEGAEPDRPDRMLAFDIEATFSQGSIRGHSYATHCESLDKL